MFSISSYIFISGWDGIYVDVSLCDCWYLDLCDLLCEAFDLLVASEASARGFC